MLDCRLLQQCSSSSSMEGYPIWPQPCRLRCRAYSPWRRGLQPAACRHYHRRTLGQPHRIRHTGVTSSSSLLQSSSFSSVCHSSVFLFIPLFFLCFPLLSSLCFSSVFLFFIYLFFCLPLFSSSIFSFFLLLHSLLGLFLELCFKMIVMYFLECF